jgi:hypothetical protein
LPYYDKDEYKDNKNDNDNDNYNENENYNENAYYYRNEKMINNYKIVELLNFCIFTSGLASPPYFSLMSLNFSIYKFIY